MLADGIFGEGVIRAGIGTRRTDVIEAASTPAFRNEVPKSVEQNADR